MGIFSIFKKEDKQPTNIIAQPLEYKTTRASKLNLNISQEDVTQYQDVFPQVDAVYSCVSFASDICSQIEFKLYKKTDSGLEEYTHPALSTWLQQPNPFTSMSETIKVYIQSYLLTGKAFITFEKVGKQFEGWVLNPAKIKIVPHAKKFIEGFTYADSVAYKANEVLYFRNPVGTDLYGGLSPLATLVDALEIDGYASEDLKDYYKNSLVAQGIFSSEYPLTTDQTESLREQFKRLHSLGKSARHAHIIAPNNMKFTPMKVSPKDGLLLESLGITENKIYKVFRLPSVLVGDSFKNTNGTEVNALKVNYINSYIRPMLFQLTQNWTTAFRRILKEEDIVIVPDYSNIPEVNTALTEKIDSVKDAVSTGLLTRNEGRETLGFDRVKNAKYMDAIYAPAYLLGTQNTDLVTGESLVFGETDVGNKNKEGS